MKKCTIFMMVFILIPILSLGCNVTVAYEYSDNKIVDIDGESIELNNPSDYYVNRLGRKMHKL